MKVQLKNQAGALKEQKVGFSWTTLFFGCYVPLFRGNWSEFFKFFFLSPITFSVWHWIQMFTLNKKEIIKLTEKGYEPASKADKKLLQDKGIIAMDD